MLRTASRPTQANPSVARVTRPRPVSERAARPRLARGAFSNVPARNFADLSTEPALWRPREFSEMFKPFGSLLKEMESMMRGVWLPTFPWLESEVEIPTFRPRADVARYDDKYVMCLDLPGLTRDSVKIEMTDDEHLSISGERKAPENTEAFTRLERQHGVFKRLFKLPTDADTGAIKATMKDGVLTVEIPRTKRTSARTIEIEAAE